MRLLLLCIILSLTSVALCANHHQAEVEDNEFAEFEEFDEDEVVQEKETKDQTESKPTPIDIVEEDENEVKVEEEEFDHFSDEEEFEGLEEQSHQKIKPEKPDLKITKVPLHLRSNWESFYMEFLMIAGLLVYFINFVAGRNKNQKLAMAWFNSHKHLLESNFALVGDDGKKEIENPGLVKESENVYTLWCSGRVCVEGMLVELKLLKRQDLVSVVSRFFRPASDQILIKVHMNADAMDSFVFCVAKKKTALALGKEMTDLCTYCPDKKSAEKYGLSSNFTIMSEVGEASNAMLDSKVVALTKKYEQNIDYIHFSDQYSGPKLQEDSTPTKLPEVKKLLMFGFSVPGQGKVTPEIMETLKPLLQLVFYYVEKVKRFNLSKEAKTKAEKNRQKVEEAFIKTTHAQRQEAAQQRREEKRRAEKERILNEEDPEKQRKWEDREHRRELKKKAPKMKQLKVKAL